MARRSPHAFSAEEMVEFASGLRGMCLNLEADNVSLLLHWLHSVLQSARKLMRSLNL